MTFYTTPNPRRRRPLRSKALAALLLAACSLAFLATTAAFAQDVEPSAAHRADINHLLAADLAAAAGPVSFLVILHDQPDPIALLSATELQSAAAVDRRTALYAALTAHAAATQAPLRAWLDARGVPYTPHYLANMIEVQGDAALAAALRLRPEVDRLARNPAVRQSHAGVPTARLRPYPAPAGSGAAELSGPSALWPAVKGRTPSLAPALLAAAPPTTLPYGLTYTKADGVWSLGIRGAGIVVGSQDTGVQWDHPALRNAYRGFNAQAQTTNHVYNWFDAFGRNQLDTFNGCSPNPQVPCDDGSHGTHTVGTMVGDATPDGGAILGMAPAAEWVACRNMRNGVGTPSSYTTCFEWFLAPYPQGGDPFADGKPALAPDVVNNSWGCPPSEGCDVDTLEQIVNTVRAGGIFIAASAGNGGALGCSTVVDPIGLYDSSFSVGAHDQNGAIALFSSRGPVTADGSSRLKPDLSAPGVNVWSTFPAPLNYGPLSGTSMASPHVAGAVALLWSLAPELRGDIDATEQILRASATPVINGDCDAGPVSPNNVYGYGRLNILQAVLTARPPATATVTLVGAPSAALGGIPVELVNEQTSLIYTGVTGADGKVQITGSPAQPLLSGRYTIRAARCGLASELARGAALLPNQVTPLTLTAPSTTCQYLPLILP
jgi:subtilisin family serine protease